MKAHKGVRLNVAYTAKQIDFIDELTQRTLQGNLRWQRAVVKDTYIVAFPNHAIQVSGPGTPFREDYSLRIYDGEGNVTLEIGGRTENYSNTVEHSDFYPVRQKLIALYDAVRALLLTKEDVDKIIEDVLGEIRQVGSEGVKAR